MGIGSSRRAGKRTLTAPGGKKSRKGKAKTGTIAITEKQGDRIYRQLFEKAMSEATEKGINDAEKVSREVTEFMKKRYRFRLRRTRKT